MTYKNNTLAVHADTDTTFIHNGEDSHSHSTLQLLTHDETQPKSLISSCLNALATPFYPAEQADVFIATVTRARAGQHAPAATFTQSQSPFNTNNTDEIVQAEPIQADAVEFIETPFSPSDYENDCFLGPI